MRHAIAQILLLVSAGLAAAAGGPTPPLRQHGGSWPTGHVQGVAVDLERGHVYYSFTTLLAKYDFKGRLIGTLTGWTGHLGDLDFNPRDRRVYGSLEYKKHRAFYVAMIDVDRIDRADMDVRTEGILRAVFLPEVAEDYSADVDGDGAFGGDTARTADHRYGCSGIDGVSFGPRFGRTDGPRLLTVAYGVYGNTERADNDHQVLLQYDVGGWDEKAAPVDEAAPHRIAGRPAEGKCFVRTGNTTYGVQNLAYDEHLGRWFMAVYKGAKPAFPNYLLFAVDARTPPARGRLLGVAGHEEGMLVALADDGLRDEATGVRGWRQKADVGLQPIGGGLWYLARNFTEDRRQAAEIALMRWTGVPEAPFTPATADDLARLRPSAR